MAKSKNTSAHLAEKQSQTAMTPAQHALSIQLSNATTAHIFLERVDGALQIWSRMANTEWEALPEFARDSAPGFKVDALQLMMVAIERDLKTARDIWWEHGHSFNCEAPTSLGIAQSFVAALSGLLWIDVASVNDDEKALMDFSSMSLTADMAIESLMEAVGELEAAIRALEAQMAVDMTKPAAPATMINLEPPTTTRKARKTLEPLAA
ncbi:MAG: hypothetical protein RI907_987 [Pseudomonadota bacterium]|jgi:hypothetical protein